MAASEDWLMEKSVAAKEQGKREKSKFKSSSHQLPTHTELHTPWMKEILTQCHMTNHEE